MPEWRNDAYAANRQQEAESEPMPIDQLHHAVTFSCFRGALDWDNVHSIATTFEPQRLDENEHKLQISPHWYRMERGDYALTTDRLAYASVYAPELHQVRNGGAWELLGTETRLPAERLITFIRRLPPRLVMGVLEDPDPISGMVMPHIDLRPEALREVQKLGNFDALSALLALTDLYDLFGDRLSAKRAVRVAGKLFLHISPYPPFAALAIDFWIYLKRRYLDRFAPDEFDCYIHERNRLDLVTHVARDIGIIGGRWRESIQLLYVADQHNIAEIESAALEAESWSMEGATHRPTSPALQKLAKHYHDEFGEDQLPPLQNSAREKRQDDIDEALVVINEFI